MLKLGPKFHEFSNKNIGPLTYPLKSLCLFQMKSPITKNAAKLRPRFLRVPPPSRSAGLGFGAWR